MTIANFNIPQELVFKILLYLDRPIMSEINREGRDQAARLQSTVTTAFENACAVATERLRLSLVDHLASQEGAFADTDIIERVVRLGPESILRSLEDHFLAARFGEDPADEKRLERNLRLEFGNKEAIRILSNKTACQGAVDAFCRKYDSALISLYRNLPDEIQRDNLDLQRQPIIPENFRTLSPEEQAIHVRVWLEAKSGIRQGILNREMEFVFPSRMEVVSVLPYELQHLTGVSEYHFDFQRDTTIPRIFQNRVNLRSIRVVPYVPFLMNHPPLDVDWYFNGGHITIPFQLLIGTTKITPQIVAAFPECLRIRIYTEIGKMSGSPIGEDPLWGEHHAGDDLHLLRQCTLKEVFSRLQRELWIGMSRLSGENFGRICFHVWDLAGRPEDKLGDWGERYLLTDFQRFEKAVVCMLFEKLSPQDQDLFDFLIWIEAGRPEGDPLYGNHHRYDGIRNDPGFKDQLDTINKYRLYKEQYDRLDGVWQEKIYTEIVARRGNAGINLGEDFLFLTHRDMFSRFIPQMHDCELCYRIMGDCYSQVQARLPEDIIALYTEIFGEEELTRTRICEMDPPSSSEGFTRLLFATSTFFIFHKLEELGHHMTREEAVLLEEEIIPLLQRSGPDAVPRILERILPEAAARERFLEEMNQEVLYFLTLSFRASLAPIPGDEEAVEVE